MVFGVRLNQKPKIKDRKPKTKTMLSFIIRRLLLIIPMALVVITLTWGLIRLAPGNFYDNEKNLPKAVVENIKEKYGLNLPWYQQYGIMLWNTIRGDFEEKTWSAFQLTVIEGRPTAEVAAELDLSPESVRQARSRVLRRLREEMEGQT